MRHCSKPVHSYCQSFHETFCNHFVIDCRKLYRCVEIFTQISVRCKKTASYFTFPLQFGQRYLEWVEGAFRAGFMKGSMVPLSQMRTQSGALRRKALLSPKVQKIPSLELVIIYVVLGFYYRQNNQNCRFII